MLNKETVLITGASSGIGLHLAREFAAHGHSLILVAPVEAELRAVAAELSQGRDIKVISIPKDLEQPHAAEEIFDELQALGMPVDILVNNAGHGFYGRWWEQSIDKDLSMLRLNVEAALWLTKLFLKPMLQRGNGRILNTASVASFEPGPLMSVYHATKAFLLSWSEALAMELEDTPITITVLCPGATDTDFFPKAGMVGSRIFQKGNLMAPQEVAKAGYAGVMQGELFVIPGALNKAMVAARRFLPESAQARVNQKLYETIPADEQKRHRGDIEKAAQD